MLLFIWLLSHLQTYEIIFMILMFKYNPQWFLGFSEILETLTLAFLERTAILGGLPAHLWGEVVHLRLWVNRRRFQTPPRPPTHCPLHPAAGQPLFLACPHPSKSSLVPWNPVGLSSISLLPWGQNRRVVACKCFVFEAGRSSILFYSVLKGNCFWLWFSSWSQFFKIPEEWQWDQKKSKFPTPASFLLICLHLYSLASHGRLS